MVVEMKKAHLEE